MSKLLSQGGFGCVYYPGLTCQGESTSRKDVVTKLQKDDFNAKNEITIGKLVADLPNYSLFYLPVMKSCPVDLRAVDKKLVSQCDIVQHGEDIKYVLMEIPFVANKPFYGILTQAPLKKRVKKHIMLDITQSYSYLLNSINYLLSLQIVHFDLKGDNILYNTQTGDPQIIDFGISIPIKTLNDQNIRDYFYAYAPEYYVWPLEVHVINYLLHVSEDKLTKEDAVLIAKSYTESNKALDIYSPEFRQKFQDSCERQMNAWVGKPRNKTIYDLAENYKTWDNYALSVLYLKMFEYMFPSGFHRNPMLIRFSQLLLLNLSPSPSKRKSLTDTEKTFREIFYIEGDVGNYIAVIKSMNYDIERTTKRINQDLLELRQLSIRK